MRKTWFKPKDGSSNLLGQRMYVLIRFQYCHSKTDEVCIDI